MIFKFLRSRKTTSTEPNAIVTCAVVQLRQSTSRESNEIMIYSLSCFQINEGNPHQDQSHCHLLLILSTAPAEEPLGHQHQQEERSHRTNLGVNIYIFCMFSPLVNVTKSILLLPKVDSNQLRYESSTPTSKELSS